MFPCEFLPALTLVMGGQYIFVLKPTCGHMLSAFRSLLRGPWGPDLCASFGNLTSFGYTRMLIRASYLKVSTSKPGT